MVKLVNNGEEESHQRRGRGLGAFDGYADSHLEAVEAVERWQD